MSSLDPRINRLGLSTAADTFLYAATEGQPYELFWIAKQGKPYEHVGIVHAYSPELALVYAKEQYSRRGGTCFGLLSAASDTIWSSAVTDDGQHIFDELDQVPVSQFTTQTIYVFGLKRRGKQHTLLGTVNATIEADFLTQLLSIRPSQCVNLWLVEEKDIAVLEAGPEGLWNTLPEKQYREATSYKSADKIKAYLLTKESK
jgi:ring-1,2-phenylacetyl-CoA epoxidase subunit PaaB